MTKFCIFKLKTEAMTFYRNFTYWIDKRIWKYYFLMLSLQLSKRA